MTRKELIDLICEAVSEDDNIKGFVFNVQKESSAHLVIINTSEEYLHGLGKRLQLTAEKYMMRKVNDE